MKTIRSVLRDATTDGGGGGGGGGGAAFDFRPLLPEDVRSDPVFEPLKPKDDKELIALLGKGYANAQKLVGVNRLPVPQKDWKPEQWAAFNKATGVPEKHDAYTTPEFKFEKGLELDPTRVDGWKQRMHKLGLRPDQVQGIMTEYFNEVNGLYKGDMDKRQQAAISGEAELREAFGDQYEGKMDIARAVVKKYGSEELLTELEGTSLASNPKLMQFLAKMGESLFDDTAGGDGGGLPIGAKAQAQQQIAALKQDTEFMDALNRRENVGHQAAVDKWLALHKAAAGPAPQNQG